MIPVRVSGNNRSGKNSNGAVSDETFRKREHILKSKDFRNVYKNGRSFKKSGFVLSAMSNGLMHNRLGFSISASNVRSAGIRNRIRRLFREIYRKNKPILKTAYDMVLIVRKDPGKRFLYEDAWDAFLALTKEAGILL